jgi:hypothetical protein
LIGRDVASGAEVMWRGHRAACRTSRRPFGSSPRGHSLSRHRPSTDRWPPGPSAAGRCAPAAPAPPPGCPPPPPSSGTHRVVHGHMLWSALIHPYPTVDTHTLRHMRTHQSTPEPRMELPGEPLLTRSDPLPGP